MIHIVIPIFNAKAYLEECLGSLRRQTFREFRIWVVDDGSSDGSGEILRDRFPEVSVIRGTGNWWWTRSMNEGLARVLEVAREDDYFLSLNIDLHVGPRYLESLLAVAAAGRPCVVGSPVADAEDLARIVFVGVEWNPWTARYKGLSAPRVESAGPMRCWGSDILPGRGTLFPIEVFRKLGPYDAEGMPQYAADDDMSLRARENGYPLLIAPEAMIFSHVRATGLNFQVSRDLSLSKFLTSLRSIRSPYYLKARARFARVHAKVFPLYVSLDLLRICGSYVREILRAIRDSSRPA